MAYNPQKVIDTALSQVSYLEKASNSQLDSTTSNAGRNNYTKYARDLDAISFYNGKKQGFAWCDVFVDWCFVKAYGKTEALALTYQPTNAKNNCGAGCQYSYGYYKAKGQLHSKPKVGDQIFFGKPSKVTHTGLVYKVDQKRVYTVEGNTSGASGVVPNGGGVCKKSYALTHSGICGYGRPAYGKQTQTTYTVKKGDSLWRIAANLLGDGKRYKEIMQLNGLSHDVIKVGQKLKIPSA